MKRLNINNGLKKNPFIKNVAIMATGTAGAQAVTMLLSPIITRLYGPEAFGIMGTFTALTGIITPVVALTYPIAIVLPKSDHVAKGLIKLSLYVTIIITIITSLILVFFNNSIVSLFQLEEIKSFMYLIPVVIFFSGLMQVYEQWLIRTNQFLINAKARLLQAIITNMGKVGLGLVYPLATVLVSIQAITNGIRAVIMMLYERKSSYKISTVHNEIILPVRKLAKKYIDFPLYRAPEVFISSISQNLPVLLLTSLFGPVAAGLYNIGRMVLGLPSMLIGQAIGDVFYPRISEAANKREDLAKLIKKATLLLGGIGIIPFGIVIFFGPLLFEFVFGAEWNAAGEYARWIALASYSIFINKPSVRAMPVLNAQRFHLLFTILVLIIRSSTLVIGFFIFESDIVAVALFGISSLILNLLLIWITLIISKKI